MPNSAQDEGFQIYSITGLTLQRLQLQAQATLLSSESWRSRVRSLWVYSDSGGGASIGLLT